MQLLYGLRLHLSINGDVINMTPKKIALLTDSCADLTPETAAAHGIYMVPLKVRCLDGEYADGVTIRADDVITRLKRGELPQTSLPDGGAVDAALDRIAADGYDGVVAVMLSGGLSGTANMVRIHGKVRQDLAVSVFDSRRGSMAQGMILLQLAEDLRGGMDWERLTGRRVEQLIRGTRAFFSVDTLEYLQKGGRIGRVTALAGTMLQIKPILTFAENGELCSASKVRGRRQIQDKLAELLEREARGHRAYNLAVVNCQASQEMLQMKDRLAAMLPDYRHFWTGELDGTLSVYIGSGVLGACVQYLD